MSRGKLQISLLKKFQVGKTLMTIVNLGKFTCFSHRKLLSIYSALVGIVIDKFLSICACFIEILDLLRMEIDNVAPFRMRGSTAHGNRQ